MLAPHKLLLLIGLIFSQGGCRSDPAPAGDSRDIVLILVNGLRADPQGEEGAEAALLEALERKPALRYRNAYAQTPSPRVSLGSLLTGMYPSAIPLCGRYVPREYDQRDRGQEEGTWCTSLTENRHTLPQVLGLYDYRSAVIRGPAFGAELITGRFDTEIALEPDPPTWTTDWPALLSATQGWWNQDDSKPRLLVIMIPDLQLPALARYFEEAGIHPRSEQESTAHPEILREHYQQDAAAIGAHLRGVLDAVEGTGTPPWVVLTSSNGMSLAEQASPSNLARAQAYDHTAVPTTQIILDRTIHVPLVIYGPVAERGEPEEAVELIDLLPTLTGIAGAVAPAQAQGRDLLASAGGSRGAYAEFGDMMAIRSEEWLLTFRCYLHNGTSLDPELTRRFEESPITGEFFSLHKVTEDPLQQENLQAQALETVRTLRDQLLERRKGPASPPPEALGEEELKAIRLAPALGYW